MAELNQTVADQIGCPEYVRQVAEVYPALPIEGQRHAVLFTATTARPGILDRYGEPLGLPAVYSGQNGLHNLGPPPDDKTVATVVPHAPRCATVAAWPRFAALRLIAAGRVTSADQHRNGPEYIATTPEPKDMTVAAPLMGRTRVRIAVVLAALALVTGTVAAVVAFASPTADTRYSFESQAGDRVGAGKTRTYQAPSATITAIGPAAAIDVSVVSGDEWWTIRLAAPRGQVLRPGVYRKVERPEFDAGTAAGLDVSGNGRTCDRVFGEFTVDQLTIEPSGSIAVLDADFVQRCGNASAPELRGAVHYRAGPLSYRFDSDPGDHIGRGEHKSYTNSTAGFLLSGTTALVRIRVSTLNGDNWDVELGPPAGQRLKVGEYTRAERGAPDDKSRPSFYVSGPERACESTGSFRISKLVADGTGRVKALAVSFEQRCEGQAPALRGEVHYFA